MGHLKGQEPAQVQLWAECEEDVHGLSDAAPIEHDLPIIMLADIPPKLVAHHLGKDPPHVFGHGPTMRLLLGARCMAMRTACMYRMVICLANSLTTHLVMARPARAAATCSGVPDMSSLKMAVHTKVFEPMDLDP